MKLFRTFYKNYLSFIILISLYWGSWEGRRTDQWQLPRGGVSSRRVVMSQGVSDVDTTEVGVDSYPRNGSGSLSQVGEIHIDKGNLPGGGGRRVHDRMMKFLIS